MKVATLTASVLCFVLGMVGPLLAQVDQEIGKAPDGHNWQGYSIALALACFLLFAGIMRAKRDYHD
jgi:hypothetical protein